MPWRKRTTASKTSAVPQALTALARARLRWRQGRDDDAARELAWLRQHAPAGLRHRAILDAAQARERIDGAAALVLYRDVIDDDPEDRTRVSALLGTARVLEAAGQASQALQAYETAVLRVPADPRTPDIRRHILRLRAATDGTG